MRQLFFLVLFLTTTQYATAQNAVVEESLTDVECISPTQVIIHIKEVTTILNEHGADLATFVCSCSKNDKLTRFKGQVTDATGRVLRKFKESELKQTEYSQYLAIDDYKMYLDYTPPVYPVTVTYEWTMESNDDLIEFPHFCPQTDYDVSVKKAVYRLKTPKSINIRHAQQNIGKTVNVSDDSKGSQILSLELSDLPALKYEPYSRPFHDEGECAERLLYCNILGNGLYVVAFRNGEDYFILIEVTGLQKNVLLSLWKRWRCGITIMDGTNGDKEPLPRDGSIPLTFDISIDSYGGPVLLDIHASNFSLRHPNDAL